MRATIWKVTDKISKTNKKYYEVLLEGDDRQFGTWNIFKEGEEAEIEISQNGDFWNIKKIKSYSEPATKPGVKISVQASTMGFKIKCLKCGNKI